MKQLFMSGIGSQNTLSGIGCQSLYCTVLNCTTMCSIVSGTFTLLTLRSGACSACAFGIIIGHIDTHPPMHGARAALHGPHFMLILQIKDTLAIKNGAVQYSTRAGKIRVLESCWVGRTVFPPRKRCEKCKL